MLRAVAFALIGACVITCSSLALSLSLSPEDEAARDIALQWLGVVDSGNYKDAALLISEEVRGSRDWTKYFAAHRAPLGRMNSRKIAEVKHASTVPGDPEFRRHAIVRFKTSFEHKVATTEEIVLTKMGCCWEVIGYEVN